LEQHFERRPWLLPVLLFGLALLLLRPAILPLVPGAALDGHDFTGNVYPLYGYTTEQVLAGELPLWNPRQFTGFPVAGNPQAALFYPPTWAIWGLGALGVSVPRAVGLMVILHVGLAAWGAAALGRRYEMTYLGALAVGVVYAMSGWAGSRIYAGHYTILTTYAWLPWVLAAFHTALARRTLPALLPPIGALGIMALAGHPQMVLYAVLAAVVMVIAGAITEDAPALGTLWDGAWRLGVTGAGALILGAALVLPTAELTQYSTRSATDIEFVNNFALPSEQLTTLALPLLYGNPRVEPSYYWGADTFEETSAYAGLLPLLALALMFRLRSRHVVFWAGLAALGVVLALGVEGVLFGLLVRWVPGFSLFRAPGRFLFFVTVGLAGLSGLLISHLQRATPDRRAATLAPALRALPFIGLGLLVGGVYFSGWFASASHVEPMPHRARLVSGVLSYTGLVAFGLWGVVRMLSDPEAKLYRAGLACALVLVTLDAWRAVVPIVTATDVVESPLWDAASASIPTGPEARLRAFPDPSDYFESPVNIASLSGHLSVEGYDPLELDAYTRLVRMAGHGIDSPVYDLLGLRYVVTWEPREDAGYDLIGVNDGGIAYENSDPFPRAWVAVEGELLPDDGAARQRIRDGDIDLPRRVILSEPLDCELGDDPGTAEISSLRAERRHTYEVESDGGVLVFSDAYFPGWRATVDGEPTPVARAFTALRAVCVPPGEVEVTFRYRPPSVIGGAAASGIGWVLWAGATVIWSRRRDEADGGKRMTEQFLYLTTTGRVTGKPHKIEIWFVEHEGCYFLCSEHRKEADWVQNLMASPFVTFALGTSTDDHNPMKDGIAIPLADSSARAKVVKALFDAKYDWSNGLIVQVCWI
jgi:hypothetical protein